MKDVVDDEFRGAGIVQAGASRYSVPKLVYTSIATWKSSVEYSFGGLPGRCGRSCNTVLEKRVQESRILIHTGARISCKRVSINLLLKTRPRGKDSVTEPVHL